MRKNTPTLLPDSIYQVYNRGINSEILFKEPRNYTRFLQKLALYILPVAELYAYCLMESHFHLCIRTHCEELIRSNFQLDRIPPANVEHSCSWYISNRFASFFKSYAQSINKAFNRTGGLFEEPFRRLEVTDETDLCWLICYVHSNPKLHGLLEDFPLYPYSSYSSLLDTGSTVLNRDFVLSAFGGRQGFETFHRQQIPIDVLRLISLD